MANGNDRRNGSFSHESSSRESTRGSTSRRSTRPSPSSSLSSSSSYSSRLSRSSSRSADGSRSTRAGRAAQRKASKRAEREAARAEREAARTEREAARATSETSSFAADASSAAGDAARAERLSAVPGGRYEGPASEADAANSPEPEYVSTSVGQLRRAARAERAERLRKSSRRYLMRFIIVIGVVVALLAGWAALYNSPAFTIQHVQVNGVTHLTDAEMAQLANIPEGETLLRVDTEAVRERMMQTAWVSDAEVKRVFPDTLEINATERGVQAIVEIPTSSGSNVKKWAISDDHIWLMPIPEEGSEGAKTTSAQIYEDEKNALHIVDVPFGTKAEIGKECADGNVNNALDIVNGMTTELSSRVTKVSAAGPAETTLILDNGVEIAFGKAEDIRDKERVVLKILEEHPDGVAYINVRMVDQPTWRAV